MKVTMLKPGRPKVPRMFYGKCRYCECEFLVSESELAKPHAGTCDCPNKSCGGRVDLTTSIPDEYKEKVTA